LLPYENEGKRNTKWYTELFKRLIIIPAHNTFLLYRKRQNVQKLSHLDFIIQITKELFNVGRI
jgi:hypothetical protein